MKSVQYNRTGRPNDVVELIEAPSPVAGSGEVVVEVEAAPINPSHLLTLAGVYGIQPPLPAVPGAEGVGRIVAIGSSVRKFEIGQRVMIPAYSGTWRQQVAVAAEKIEVTYPDGGDPVQLSMLMANPPTAYLLLREAAELRAGDWVIQNAANSAVGQYLIQLARLWGIKTVNIVRRDGPQTYLKEIGAEVVLVDGPNLRERVSEATGNAAITTGIDAVAGDATARLAACLTDGGRIISYGRLDSANCNMPANDLIFRDIGLAGFWFTRWLQHVSTVAQRQSIYNELGELVISGALRARVAATYPLSDIKEAVSHAMRSERDGKIVLTPNFET
jgi:NADPH:quinone reductase-like Zn-dependent oxidoreductase